MNSSLVFPVVRDSKLGRPTNGIEKENAKSLAELLVKNWQVNQRAYKDAIEQVLDSLHEKKEESYYLDSKESPRITEEWDKSYVLDYPEIKVSFGKFFLNVRITTAICYHQSSTKNWARVSVDKGVDYNSEYEQIKNLQNTIAGKCSEVSYEIFESLVKNHLNSNVDYTGEFLVLAFGIDDRKLGIHLNELDTLDLKLKDLLVKNKSAINLFKNYFKKFANIEPDFAADSNENFWVETNSGVLYRKQKLVDAKTIFNMRVEDGKIMAIGIGEDGSGSGKVARLSSLEIARFFSSDI